MTRKQRLLDRWIFSINKVNNDKKNILGGQKIQFKVEACALQAGGPESTALNTVPSTPPQTLQSTTAELREAPKYFEGNKSKK